MTTGDAALAFDRTRLLAASQHLHDFAKYAETYSRRLLNGVLLHTASQILGTAPV
jgi:hypothetical protein